MNEKRKQKDEARVAAILADQNVTTRPSQRVGASHLMDFSGELRETKKQLAEAKVLNEKFKDSVLTIKIKPELIDVSEFANRAEENYSHKEFETLKQQIQITGGNEQPIKVRPKGEGRYELVYGHRRHRACLDIGLEVLAIVENMDDKQLWLYMTRENEQRQDLSFYEKAKHYQRAINHGIYKNWAAIAQDLGVGKPAMTNYKMAISIPEDVIEKLISTLELTTRDALVLSTLTDEQKTRISKLPEKVLIEDLIKLIQPPEKKFSMLNFSFGTAIVTNKQVKMTLDIAKFGQENVQALLDHIKTYQKDQESR